MCVPVMTSSPISPDRFNVMPLVSAAVSLPALGQLDCRIADHATSRKGVPAMPGAQSERDCKNAFNPQIRCRGPIGDQAICSRCQELSLDCIWLERARRGEGQNVQKRRLSRTAVSSPSITPHSQGDDNPTYTRLQSILNQQLEFKELVRRYFGTVHYYGYLTFVHEPSYWRLVDRGEPPRGLTALMIACTLRFTGDTSSGAMTKADEVYNEAFARLLPQMYQRYGAVDLMTTLLARIFEHARGRFSASWMMVGNSVRMMQYLSLHTFDTSYPENPPMRRSPLLQRESLRRLAWAVFYLDCMVDAGLHGVHTVQEASLHIQLPSNDATFARGDSGLDHRGIGTTFVTTQTDQSISSHIIQTMAMRRQISHFVSSAKYSPLPSSALHEQLDGLQVELKALIGQLPQDLAYSEGNLFVHAERRTAFILLHVLRHSCFLVLFEARLELFKAETTQFSVTDRKRPEQVEMCMRQRLKHAVSTAHIIRDTTRLDINSDPYVGSLAYSALEIIIFDPIRLRQLHPTAESDPRQQVHVDALTTLIQLLRRIAPREEGIQNLRMEACRRLLSHGYEDLVTQSDRDVLHRLISTPGIQNESEYDLRSFHWHRYEPRLKPPGLQTGAYLSPVRTLATNESMLDPSASSTVPSPSPTGKSSDAAAVDASTDNIETFGSLQKDLVHAADVSLLNQTLGHRNPIRSSELVDESLLPWLQFDFQVAHTQRIFADQSEGQWNALDYDSWTDETSTEAPVSSSNVEHTFTTERQEVGHWPFQ